ncbi:MULTISPECIES: hypothetical protein [unclassified Sphingomonas]|uniref:hypothetical protein n=1 Tax=unclassified Sphingomonas TaxID=196159 RepID=UPI0006FE0C3E|nr:MULTISPECIES: hypothetical protein [unclassified Sphingomonas]KQM62369.1 hypothetical protein ASE65_05095 [Sphingomonas sp. Leaf16]KQN13772.1 hypothetical protein ASE81_05165 [Sphingomonas sp. Leaf29]KQN22998.1 hypothetical protein ASE83_00245 [Sphingomonas sp. Leaf32]
MRRAWMVLAVTPLTGGCVSTVWNVATAPVRAGAQVVDWTTTSQSEADRNYGRKMRKKEAREGRELRKEEARRRRERRDDD